MMHLSCSLLYSILFVMRYCNGSYEWRGWSYQGIMIETCPGSQIYARSPFNQYGRGEALLVDGYCRYLETTMFVHQSNGYAFSALNYYEGLSSLSPKAGVPATFNTYPDGTPNFENVFDEGDNYGYWNAVAGNLKTGKIFGVSSDRRNVTYSDGVTTYSKDIGCVYMYAGDYKLWSQTQILQPNYGYKNSNVDDTKVQRLFGHTFTIDQKTSSSMIVGAPGLYDYNTKLYTGAAFNFILDTKSNQWSENQMLVPPDGSQQDYFGDTVMMYDDFMMISSTRDDDLGMDSGSVYVYREHRIAPHGKKGEANKWSMQQKLLPYDNAYPQSKQKCSDRTNFNSGIKANMHGRTFVVGDNLNSCNTGKYSGAAYIWNTLPTIVPEEMAEWERGKKLWEEKEAKKKDKDKENELDMNNQDVLKDDSLSENSILGTADHNNDAYPVPKPTPKFIWWSMQQKLTPYDPHEYRIFGAWPGLYQNLLVIGGNGEALDSSNWDIEDKIINPTFQIGSAYVFIRGENTLQWSFQQKIFSPNQYYQANFADAYLHGSQLIIRDGSVGYVYRDNIIGTWNCLQVTIYDTFGDGWDTAWLTAMAPEEVEFTLEADQYHTRCDKPNPSKFRYCPLNPEDDGIYKFSIPKYNEHKFWPEIGWKIFNEKSNETIRGEADTEMYFEWRGQELSFFQRPRISDRIRNVKCEVPTAVGQTTSECGCPAPYQRNYNYAHQSKMYQETIVSSEVKNGVSISRVMIAEKTDNENGKNDNDIEVNNHKKKRDEDDKEKYKIKVKTPSPSISPAPTMTSALLLGEANQHIYLEAPITQTWVKQSCLGTYFYIYDKYGTDLLYKGSVCYNSGQLDCFIPLEDGTYILRVAGVVDEVSDAVWTYCGNTFSAPSQLTFTIQYGRCFGHDQVITPTTYCSNTLGFAEVIEGLLYFEYEEDEVADVMLTTNELKAIHDAIMQHLSRYVINEIIVENSEGEKNQIYFWISINMEKSGYDGHDPKMVTSVYEAVYSMLNDKTSLEHLKGRVVLNANKLIGLSSSADLVSETSLLTIRRISLVSMEEEYTVMIDNGYMDKRKEFHSASILHESDTSSASSKGTNGNENEVVIVTTNPTSELLMKVWDVESVLGYVLAGVFVVMYGVWVIRRNVYRPDREDAGGSGGVGKSNQRQGVSYNALEEDNDSSDHNGSEHGVSSRI